MSTPSEQLPQIESRESEVLQGATAEVAPPPEEPQKHDAYAAFRVPAYRLYVISFVMAIIGSQTLSAAANYDVYEKTSSSLMVGMIGLANAIPLLTLALPAGHVADTFSRKRVLILTQAVLVTCPLILSFWHTLPAMFSLLVVNAVALTFGRPARAAILPNLVPKEIFANAVTWNSSVFELASSMAPAFTGFVIAIYGASTAYLISGFAMAGCMVLTCFLPPVPSGGNKHPMSLRTLVAGAQFVVGNRTIFGPMLLDLLAVIFSGVVALLPAFADMLTDNPKDRAVVYGWLMAGPSIGAVIMAVIQAHLPPMRRAGRVMLLAVTGYGLVTVIFGLSSSFWLCFAMLVMTGVFDNLSVVVRHTLVQLATPDSMRGRVSAVNQIFIISSNELGKVESGVLAWLVGPVWAVVGGGFGTLAVVAWITKAFPELRRLGRLQDVRPEQTESNEAAAVTGRRVPSGASS
jgi:MFS family permease